MSFSLVALWGHIWLRTLDVGFALTAIGVAWTLIEYWRKRTFEAAIKRLLPLWLIGFALYIIGVTGLNLCMDKLACK